MAARPSWYVGSSTSSQRSCGIELRGRATMSGSRDRTAIPLLPRAGSEVAMCSQPAAARRERRVLQGTHRYSVRMMTSGPCPTMVSWMALNRRPPPCRTFQERRRSFDSSCQPWRWLTSRSPRCGSAASVPRLGTGALVCWIRLLGVTGVFPATQLAPLEPLALLTGA